MSEPLQEFCDSLGIRQTVPTIHYDEIRNNPLLFYREYVAMSQPVVIQGMVDDWPALRNWKGRSGCGDDVEKGIIFCGHEGKSFLVPGRVFPSEETLSLKG
jgi:hypothetical protein